jgi:hypothetical protein
MKTACLLLLAIASLTIGSGLMRGIAYATSDDASPERERAVTPHPSVSRRTPSPSSAARERGESGRLDVARASRPLWRGHPAHATPSPRPPRQRIGLQGGDHRPLPRVPNGEGEKSRNSTPLPRGEGGPALAGPGEGSFRTSNNTAPVRLPSAVGPTAATLSNVRHRSPNPATVGGLGHSVASNTGSIDGTRMHRRP